MGMDDRSDLPGAVVAVLGSLGLLLSLWAGWFTSEGTTAPSVRGEKGLDRIDANSTLTALQTFELTDIALIGVVFAVLILLLCVMLSGWRPLHMLIALLGAIAATGIVYSAVRSNGFSGAEYVPDLGLFFGLASSAAIVIGGLWAGLAQPQGSKQPLPPAVRTPLKGYSEDRPVAISATRQVPDPGSGLTPEEQERFLGTGVSASGPGVAQRQPRPIARVLRHRF